MMLIHAYGLMNLDRTHSALVSKKNYDYILVLMAEQMKPAWVIIVIIIPTGFQTCTFKMTLAFYGCQK